MIDASPGLSLLIMFALLVILIFTGTHVVFAIGGVAVFALFLLWQPRAISVVVQSAWAIMDSYTLIAVPMFIFMALILESSGIADDLFKSVRLWFGGVPGGMALGVVVICTIIAAMSGVTMTGVITMGILALPLMLKVGYSKTLAIGPILVGGALGVLIPPSVTFVLYGEIQQLSVGKLFMGGLIPGLMIASLSIIYLIVVSRFSPHLAPPLPVEERVGFKQKLVSLRSLVLPAFLIMAVLGTIFMGICSPTEAASAGAIGAVICACINRRFSWPMIKKASLETFGITVMIAWIMFAAYCYKSVVIGVGGPQFIREFLAALHLAPVLVVALMAISFVILGCFINEWTVLLITIPVYAPVVASFGYDPIWFGVFFLVSMQIGYLSPPFALTAFVLKGVAPPGVTMGDIYASSIPFMIIQFMVLLTLLFFPIIATWLPAMLFEI